MCNLVCTKLDHSIYFPHGFLTLDLSFHILGKSVGSTSFVESFVTKVLHEDLGTISSLPTLVDPQVAFVMFSLCYVQRLGYLLHILFPSPYIL
jgi:hypothetical protein